MKFTKKVIGMTMASVLALNVVGTVAPTTDALSQIKEVSAAEKTGTFVKKKLVTVKKSNLYTSASSKSKIKATLKKSEKVTATSQKGSFYKVSYGSLTGYIFKKNLKAVDSSKGETIEKTYFLTSDTAPLYESYSKASKILKILPYSIKLSTTYKIGDFYKITYGKTTGYVHKSQLSLFDAPTPTKNPTTKPMDSDMGAKHIEGIFEQLITLTDADIYVGKIYGDVGPVISMVFDTKNKSRGSTGVSFGSHYEKLPSKEKDAFMKNSIIVTEVFFGVGSKFAVDLRDQAFKSMEEKKSKLVLVDNRVFNLSYDSGFLSIYPI